MVANEIPGCFVITWRKVAQYTSKTWQKPENTYRIYLCISRPFMTKKSAQKITLELSHRHEPHTDMTQAIQEISVTIAWSPLGKPSSQKQESEGHYGKYG